MKSVSPRTSEKKYCSVDTCPVDCEWNAHTPEREAREGPRTRPRAAEDWQDWRGCSTSCGPGWGFWVWAGEKRKRCECSAGAEAAGCACGMPGSPRVLVCFFAEPFFLSLSSAGAWLGWLGLVFGWRVQVRTPMLHGGKAELLEGLECSPPGFCSEDCEGGFSQERDCNLRFCPLHCASGHPRIRREFLGSECRVV